MPERELDAYLAEHLFGWRADGNRRGNWTLRPADAGQGSPTLMKERGRAWAVTNTRFPWWTDSGDGMLLVLEAMAKRGYTCGMMFCDNRAQHVAAFYRIGARPYPPIEVAENLSREERLGASGNHPIPLAVALAAKAALEAASTERIEGKAE